MYNITTGQLIRVTVLAFPHSRRETAAVMTCVFGNGDIPEHLSSGERERVGIAVARLKLLDPAVVARVACALLRYDSCFAAQMLEVEQQPQVAHSHS